jgi:glycosyltransferase involved in cell wall biosynthesis
MAKVSVIIPAYNSIIFLPEAVESVLAQTFTDFEILIIDDGSSDGTEEWASKVSDPRLKLIRQENQGASVARNTGIAYSKGSYIAFLDADDVWRPTKLEQQVRVLDTNQDIGLVHTFVTYINEQGEYLFDAGRHHKAGNVWKEMLAREDLIFCGSTPMVRRQCFETCGVFNPALKGCEDWECWTRIAAQYSFQVLEEPLVSYRQHSHSTTKNLDLMLFHMSCVIEQAFKPVPAHLQYLKRRSHARTSFYLAERSYEAGNHGKAICLCWKALLNYPQFCLSKNYLRISVKSFLSFLHDKGKRQDISFSSEASHSQNTEL